MFDETQPYEYKEVSFIKPNKDQPILYAQSRDYVVVMHLHESIKSLLLKNKLTDQAIMEVFRETTA